MQVISLQQLNAKLAQIIAAENALHGVWVTAETSDMRVSGGHCYMELLQKHPDTGAPLARARAVIWASNFGRLNAAFKVGTGSPLASGIKIMVCVNVTYHPVYGLSLVINDINPDYTLGDLLRRRNEMLARLRAEGILDLNRTLEWPKPAMRVAVISSAGAAGYGDFIHQLYTNSRRLRFATRLFTANMQGEHTAPSVIAALDAIAARIDEFDCVVIIRGGGATSDLASFDDYDLAANVAQFPVPVITGIGHERDVTILDYVANMRVKTPTAAAEWLINQASEALDRVAALAQEILATVTSRLAGNHRQLAYLQGQVPALVRRHIDRARRACDGAAAKTLADLVRRNLRRGIDRCEAQTELLSALSPEATLRRGYSITRVNGHAVKDANELTPGVEVDTTLARGSFKSTCTITDNNMK